MIIVTGTKRSGTSMWMQILIAAGFPAFGEAFPRKWEKTIGEANPEGFYESMLREGIYYRTNPHPRTGAYFFPEQVTRHVVKVFIPGLARTDRAYIGSVVATLRPWREYVGSLERLYAMEDDARVERGNDKDPPLRMPPALEWWHENFMLLRDIAIRRHRVHVQTYDGLLRDPEKVIDQTLTWLGEGDKAAAVAAVKPGRRTQHQPHTDAIEAQYATAFDELYDAVDSEKGLSRGFLERLNEIGHALAPRIRKHQKALAEDRLRRGPPDEEAMVDPGVGVPT